LTILVAKPQLRGVCHRAIFFVCQHAHQLLGVVSMQQINKIGRSRLVGIVAEQLPESVVGIKNLQGKLGRYADDAAIYIVGYVGKALLAGHLV